MEETIDKFSLLLQKKGFQCSLQLPGTLTFEGQFTDQDATLYVIYNVNTNVVCAVSVNIFFPDFFSAHLYHKRAYDNIRSKYVIVDEMDLTDTDDISSTGFATNEGRIVVTLSQFESEYRASLIYSKYDEDYAQTEQGNDDF